MKDANNTGRQTGVPMPILPLVTPVETATALGVSVKTIYYWVNRNEIPFLKVGKHLRFNLVKVIDFFEEKTKEMRPESACLSAPSALPLRSSNGNWSLKTRANYVDSARKG